MGKICASLLYPLCSYSHLLHFRFNVSSLFPAFATTFSSTGSDPNGDKYAPYSYCDFPLPLTLAEFEKCDEIYKCQINQHLCPTNIPGANIDSYLKLEYPRLGPAHFSFPTHFVRPNETWSLAYIGESGLWAVRCTHWQGVAQPIY